MTRRPAVLLLALVLLVGCSREVAATAVPTVRSLDPDAPAPPLSEEDQAELDDLAGWREWDPCGFLEPSSVAALGASVEVALDADPSGCTVRATDAEGLVSQLVSVNLGSPHRDGPSDGETTDSIDGTEVYRSDDGPTSCAADIRLSSARVLSMSVNQLDERPTGTACAVLDTLVRPAVAALDAPPTWATDASPVLTADPCAAIREEGGSVPGLLTTGLHRCAETVGDAITTVELGVGSDELPDGDPTTVGGFDAVQQSISDGGGCRVEVVGRTSVDPRNVPEGGTVVGRVVASTTDDFRTDTPAPTCDDAVELAEAAVAASGLE